MWKIVAIRHREFGNVLDTGARRSRLRSRHQLGDGGFGAGCRDLDMTVFAIPDPTCEPGLSRRFADEPTEPNALYPADNFEMYGCHNCLTGCATLLTNDVNLADPNGIR